MKPSKKYVLCVSKDRDPLSLMFRKVYEQIPDERAEKSHYIRVIDETGEDYLYPESCFIPVVIPESSMENFRLKWVS